MNLRNLRTVTLIYLLLPNLLFLLYWVKPAIAIVFIPVLIYLTFTDRGTGYPPSDRLLAIDIVKICGAALSLSLLSGIGGFCYQTDDHWGHNVKLYELFTSPWPLRSPVDGPVISYYFGFYVVPAMLFKLTGKISAGFMILWTAAGFAVGLAWIYLALNRRLLPTLVALCVGDFPRVIRGILNILHIQLYEFGDFGIELWSVLENIFWAPNQVIPALILGGMLMHTIINKFSIERLFLPLSQTFWWAVFPPFFVFVFLTILILSNFSNHRKQVFSALYLKNVYLPGLYILLIIIFLSSHNTTPISGYIWQFSQPNTHIKTEYLINILLNVFFFIFLYFVLNRTHTSKVYTSIFSITLVLIAIIPLYRMGKANDILTRGMMPILIIMAIQILYPFTDSHNFFDYNKLKGKIIYFLVVNLLVANSIFGITRITRALHYNQITAELFPDKVKFKSIPYDQYPSIYAVLIDRWSELEATQYMGNEHSFYEIKIAPDKPELQE